MKKTKALLVLLIILIAVSFIGCNKDKDTENTEKPASTSTPVSNQEPTPTREPTPEPTSDPDADVKALLYRFAFEGEDILDTMFAGKIISYNSRLEFSEEGLLITVQNVDDPYFYIDFPDGFLDLAEYPYFKMLFKNSAKLTKGQLYIAFDGEQITSDAQHYSYVAEETDDWQEVTIDLRTLKEGAETITTFRADILARVPVDSTITIDYIGFFATQEEAQNYTPPNRRS